MTVNTDSDSQVSQQDGLMIGWEKRGSKADDTEHIVFTGTEAEFEKWKKDWFKTVPKCDDFACCHELMSCGIYVACGSCSLHRTMAAGVADRICEDVDCSNCCDYECKEKRLRPRIKEMVKSWEAKE